MMASIIEKEYIQYGFAGFAFVLLGVVIWLVKNGNNQNAALIGVIEKSNSWTAKLIDAIKFLGVKEEHSQESMDKFRTDTETSFKDIGVKVDDLREMLLSRPCMKKDN